ncbi:hypothetical protein FRC03_010787 [Tulasnella sp. 419]|nr:hypothetical protein FRC03_010787 [Tulasnella sp. 419]
MEPELLTEVTKIQECISLAESIGRSCRNIRGTKRRTEELNAKLIALLESPLFKTGLVLGSIQVNGSDSLEVDASGLQDNLKRLAKDLGNQLWLKRAFSYKDANSKLDDVLDLVDVYASSLQARNAPIDPIVAESVPVISTSNSQGLCDDLLTSTGQQKSDSKPYTLPDRHETVPNPEDVATSIEALVQLVHVCQMSALYVAQQAVRRAFAFNAWVKISEEDAEHKAQQNFASTQEETDACHRLLAVNMQNLDMHTRLDGHLALVKRLFELLSEKRIADDLLFMDIATSVVMAWVIITSSVELEAVTDAEKRVTLNSSFVKSIRRDAVQYLRSLHNNQRRNEVLQEFHQVYHRLLREYLRTIHMLKSSELISIPEARYYSISEVIEMGADCLPFLRDIERELGSLGGQLSLTTQPTFIVISESSPLPGTLEVDEKSRTQPISQTPFDGSASLTESDPMRPMHQSEVARGKYRDNPSSTRGAMVTEDDPATDITQALPTSTLQASSSESASESSDSEVENTLSSPFIWIPALPRLSQAEGSKIEHSSDDPDPLWLEAKSRYINQMAPSDAATIARHDMTNRVNDIKIFSSGYITDVYQGRLSEGAIVKRLSNRANAQHGTFTMQPSGNESISTADTTEPLNPEHLTIPEATPRHTLPNVPLRSHRFPSAEYKELPRPPKARNLPPSRRHLTEEVSELQLSRGQGASLHQEPIQAASFTDKGKDRSPIGQVSRSIPLRNSHEGLDSAKVAEDSTHSHPKLGSSHLMTQTGSLSPPALHPTSCSTAGDTPTAQMIPVNPLPTPSSTRRRLMMITAEDQPSTSVKDYLPIRPSSSQPTSPSVGFFPSPYKKLPSPSSPTHISHPDDDPSDPTTSTRRPSIFQIPDEDNDRHSISSLSEEFTLSTPPSPIATHPELIGPAATLSGPTRRPSSLDQPQPSGSILGYPMPFPTPDPAPSPHLVLYKRRNLIENNSPTHAMTKWSASFANPGGEISRERALVRQAASFLVKEMARPPIGQAATSQQSSYGGLAGGSAGVQVDPWEEVEYRLVKLIRVENVWNKGGSSGGESVYGMSSSGLTLNATRSRTTSGGGSEEKERNIFCEALRDGYVLAQLVNKLHPANPLPIPIVNPRQDERARSQNIAKFRDSAQVIILKSLMDHLDQNPPTLEMFGLDALVEATPESAAKLARVILMLAAIKQDGTAKKWLAKEKEMEKQREANMNWNGSKSRSGDRTSNEMERRASIRGSYGSNYGASDSPLNLMPRSPTTQSLSSAPTTTPRKTIDGEVGVLSEKRPSLQYRRSSRSRSQAAKPPRSQAIDQANLLEASRNSHRFGSFEPTSPDLTEPDGSWGKEDVVVARKDHNVLQAEAAPSSSLTSSSKPISPLAPNSRRRSFDLKVRSGGLAIEYPSGDSITSLSDEIYHPSGLGVISRIAGQNRDVHWRRVVEESIYLNASQAFVKEKNSDVGAKGSSNTDGGGGQTFSIVRALSQDFSASSPTISSTPKPKTNLGKGKFPDDLLEHPLGKSINTNESSRPSVNTPRDEMDPMVLSSSRSLQPRKYSRAQSRRPTHSAGSQKVDAFLLKGSSERRPLGDRRASVERNYSHLVQESNSSNSGNSFNGDTTKGSGGLIPSAILRPVLRRLSRDNAQHGIYIPRQSLAEDHFVTPIKTSSGISDSSIIPMATSVPALSSVRVPFPRSSSGEYKGEPLSPKVPNPIDQPRPGLAPKDEVDGLPPTPRRASLTREIIQSYLANPRINRRKLGTITSSAVGPIPINITNSIVGSSAQGNDNESAISGIYKRSRIESLMGMSSAASSFTDLTRAQSMAGLNARQTIVVKEDGKTIHYQLGNLLGKGQFGTVYRALNLNTGQMVAVKRIGLEGLPENEVDQLMKEVELLRTLSHPNIVKYEGMVRDKDNLNIVLEYVEGGSLGQVLKSFGQLNESLVASSVTKILEGLRYLHEQHVVHRDLKAANILNTKNGNIKLSDFGVSLNINTVGTMQDNVAGTPNWMAPEIIELKGAVPASDIWSLGCTVVELLTGRPPYAEIRNSVSVMWKIVTEDSPPLPEGCSEELQDFLNSCFQKDPAKRPSADVLFEHPWLKQSWSLLKELRPQDSVPFLRRVSVDLQKVDIARFSQQNFSRDEFTSETPPIQPTTELPPSEPEFITRPHSFVKTTFSKPVMCRICRGFVKKGLVLCEDCDLICHVRCVAEASPSCDRRGLFKSYNQESVGNDETPAITNATSLPLLIPRSQLSSKLYVSSPPIPKLFNQRKESHAKASIVVSKVAVKVLQPLRTPSMRQKFSERFFRDFQIWIAFSHRNLVPLLGFVLCSDLPYALVSPWYDNGNIIQHLSRIGLEEVNIRIWLIRDVVEGLDYLHSIGLVHGDLRGETVLVDDDGTARIANSGTFYFVRDVVRSYNIRHNIQHRRYWAPELLDKDGEDEPTLKSDVWAFGCLASQVLTNRIPYDNYHVSAILLVIRAGELPVSNIFATSNQLTTRIWEIISSCWVQSPTSRPTIQNIHHLMQNLPRRRLVGGTHKGDEHSLTNDPSCIIS